MREVINKNNKSWVEKIDDLIGIFSPLRAMRRRAARFASKHLFSATSYRGASKDRLRKDWSSSPGSADEDLLNDLETLRERSRDLNRNDAHAAGITDTITINVIGSGLKPQSRLPFEQMGLSKDTAIDFQKRAEYLWQKWVPFADSAKRLDFYEIQELCTRQILENGEIIILPLMFDEPRRPLYLSLEAVEADRLETPSGKKADKKIRSGVEIGSRGQPIAYWIKKTHPGDTRSKGWRSDDYVRIPAYNKSGRPNVIHLFPIKRPGQTRGVPFFAPAMNLFKDMASYMEAELVAARVAACFAAFIESPDVSNLAINRSTGKDAKGNRIEALEPGLIDYLMPGEKLSAFEPKRPTSAFEPFINQILRSIGSALGLPYELLVKDFSKTNYSSARAALLEARRFFTYRRIWIAKKLCQPVWNMVLEEAYLRNMIDAPDFYKKFQDYAKCRWIGAPWGWVDPTKEVEASLKALNGNLTTLSDETAALGYDYEELLLQRSRERQLEKDLGVEPVYSESKKTEKKSSEENDKEALEGIDIENRVTERLKKERDEILKQAKADAVREVEAVITTIEDTIGDE